MTHDVIIIGGSFAGLAAAMQLVRARRKVLVIDAAKPRNRFAHASHGFLGHDGMAPAMIRENALRELSAYPTFARIEAEAVDAKRSDGGFSVALGDGTTQKCQRLLLAVGVKDTLPEIEGLEALWGTGVFHCPYCHGYEIDGGPIGVLATSPLAHHQAALLPDWGETIVFINPGVEFAKEDRALIERRVARIEYRQVVSVIARGDTLTGVRLADGSTVAIKGLFVQSRVQPASPLAERLGASLAEGMQGPHIEVNDFGATAVPGLYAAGDAASQMHNATLAAASGVRVAAMIHRSLIWGL